MFSQYAASTSYPAACTAGGLVSAALLSVPGASAYYAGGLTLYTLASRLAFGGWTEADRAGYRCVLVSHPPRVARAQR